ncbi:glycosyltransferase family 4 protein [Halosimplex marinum]|uniref:glycosyltransferase family 4 protein n=1 Tax=Halosimplex marinum TaxID=3396620 RepID=UPI003F563F1F
MRILQLAEDFYPTTAGGARTDWEFAQRAVEEGHAVTVYTKRVGDAPRHEREAGVEINRPFRANAEERHPNAPLAQLRRVAFAVLLLGHLLVTVDGDEYDAVYATNHLVHPVAKLVGLAAGLPVVNFVAYTPSIDERDRSVTNPLYLLEQLNVRFFMGERVICRTPGVRDMIADRSSAEVRVNWGILNRDRVLEGASAATPAALDGRDDRTDLLWVGRVEAIKRPLAVADLVRSLPAEYHLTVVGDGTMRAGLGAAVADRGVADRVTLLGRRPHAETLASIAAADALLLTSRTEATPTVVFEALALGTDVVATPVGALPELDVEHLRLAPLDRMAECVRESAFDPDRGLRTDVLDDFSMDAFVGEVLDALAAAGPTGETRGEANA